MGESLSLTEASDSQDNQFSAYTVRETFLEVVAVELGFLCWLTARADCGGESVPGEENNKCMGTEARLSLPCRWGRPPTEVGQVGGPESV